MAVKILSPDIPHKSDVDGVRLNLANANAVREAAAGILSADRTLSRPEHRGLRELRRRYSGREEIDFSMIS